MRVSQNVVLYILYTVRASDGDVGGDMAVKDQKTKTTRHQSDNVGGRPSLTVSDTGTTGNDTTAVTSRTHVAATTPAQTKHRFKRKPRILFSQAQVSQPLNQ